jgi:uncharacterized membrane protein (UPF0127 family)
MLKKTALIPLILAASALAQDNPNRLYQLRELKSTTISYGAKKLKVMLMDNASKRQEGMMFLNPTELKPNGAMLFVFGDSQDRSFWNNNVKFDLDIAYIDAKGKAFTLKILKKMDTSSVPSGGAAKYVLEMKRGMFAKLGIKKGTTFKIPASVRSVD